MGRDQDLLQAVKDNDVPAIQKILQKLSKTPKSKIIGSYKKLNVNFQDGDGMSALHQASLMGTTDVIKLLLEAGCSAEVKDNKGMVALHYAAWQGKPDPVQALLATQPPVNEQAQNGETPLHLACQHGHLHVVKLLLTHHADPTVCNKEMKTPLDLACEFGRGRVVEQLLKSNLCEKLLEDSPIDTLDNSRTTCLHLAAKNGHSDVIRLLIESGMNINRATLNGTCLHEAALCGKTEVVWLLLQSGVDVNRLNSHEQTALDIVNKFTTSRAARHLKQLLREASVAVKARAVKDYFNAYDPQSLAFKEGDLITVLEHQGDGQWKGYVAQEGRAAQAGFFPASHVVLVDEQVVKQQQSKVPDLLDPGQLHSHNGHLHHNGLPPGSDASSVSSSSMDDAYCLPPYATNTLGPPPVYTPYRTPPPSPGGHGSHGVSRSPRPSLHIEPHSPGLQAFQREANSPGLQTFHGPPHSPGLQSFHSPPHSPALKSFQAEPGLNTFHSAPHSPRLTSFQGCGLNSFHSGPHSPGGRCHGASPSSPGIHVTAPPSFTAALGGGAAPAATPPPSPGAHLSAPPAFTVLQEIPEGSVSNHSTPTRSSQHIQAVQRPDPSGEVAATVVVVAGEVQHAEEWAGPMVAGSPAAGRDMKAHSAAACKEHAQQQQQATHQHPHHSPVHGKRNSSGSSDSGRGHLEPKVVTVSGQVNQQETGVSSSSSSRQSYHSTSSSSLGSLDRLEDPAPASTINVHHLLQAGVPDKEVLHAWLHDLHFEEYYAHFLQAGYDMPTISRMTPEDLTAIGITKPAHRKRLKAEIARLHIHDGIPDFCPRDLIEWLHMLGLGMYHETLTGQGYSDMDYITDITWEDLEEIGIKKLGHQKKIMLAIDRLKRLTSGSKRLSSMEPQRSSIEMLEPPPPAPPIGRWSGEISALPPHMYEGGLGVGAKPKKSPSGDSISTTGSAGSNSSQGSGDTRTIPIPIPIPIPREDVGIAGGVPYNRQNSAPSSAPGNYSDLLTSQAKRQGRASATEDLVRDLAGQSVYPPYHQSPTGNMGSHVEYSSSHPMCTSDPGTGLQMAPKVHPKPAAKVIVAKTRRTSRDYSPDAEMEKHESENNSDGNKVTPITPGNVAAVAAMMERTGEVYTGGTMKRGAGGVSGHLRADIREHIYDQPQPQGTSPSPKAPASPKPQVMPKPASPLHVATQHAPSAAVTGSPPGRSKKAPPPPPKRTHSIRNDAAPAVVNKVEPVSTHAMTATRSPHTTASSPATSNSNNNTKISNHSKTLPANTHITAATTTASSRQDPATGEKAQPQTEAFASCVKSLSERFGSKKHSTEGSRDSVVSEGEDFPPPPPPLAMDLITPKIHNYGIPIRADMHHGSPHARDYGHHHPNAKEHPGGLQNRMKTSQVSEASSVRPEQQSLTASESPARRISPGRDVPASTIPAQDKAKDAEVHIVPSNLGDKRSESTTSFESTTSSSSADSNTLPFANENVGTIKQRAANMKPSIVQAFETSDGQRSVDLNAALFDHSLRDNGVTQENRTSPSGASREGPAGAGAGAGGPPQGTNSHAAGYRRADSGSGGSGVTRKTIFPIPGSKHMAAGLPQGQKMASAVSRLAATAPHITRMAQQNQTSAPEAPPKPPVPSKKPVMPIQPHAPLRSHQSHHPHPHQQQQSQPAEHPPHQQPAQQQQEPRLQPQTPQQQQQQQPERKASIPSVPAEKPEEAPVTRQAGDVLSDIDDMLQGLTDELDAMLEETKG